MPQTLAAPATQVVIAPRDYSIDRLRSVMTALVIFHHTAITYGATGGWFWNELQPSSAPSSLLLTMFCATNQAYFMGFFFLLAGYYTPKSLERKGYGRFLVDRFLRLGVPLLVFLLILGPATAALVEWAQGNGFWATIRWLYAHQRIINGPLWFAQALLLFSMGYCAWRGLFGASLAKAERTAKPVPAGKWWLASALGTAGAAFLIRQWIPVGQNVFGLQLGYFAGYIFLFATGIAAWRHDWLRQLAWKNARPWIVTLIVAWPSLPISIALAKAAGDPGKANFGGGLSWTAVLYALWEPLVAWGMISLWLLVSRERMNSPSAVWDWLNRRAYAVYILHPPVLVGIALLLHGWAAPALVKFAVVGLMACAATWLVSDAFVRVPGVRRIV
jgi:peptidoglycan/LPS O-acetylase OafA/YrhL